MDWQNDPELEGLFEQELDERSKSLAEGAQAMIDGKVTPELSGRMLREGHTVKGTSRVMGQDAIAVGGETCEVIWRHVQQGELAPTGMLGRTLLLLSEAMIEASGGDEDALSDALEMISTVIDDPAVIAALPGASDVDGAAAESPSPIMEVVPDMVTGSQEVSDEHEADVDPDRGSVSPTVPVADAQDVESSEEPLVFEPGPDGKLVTPEITYEFVPADDAPAPVADDEVPPTGDSSDPDPMDAAVSTPPAPPVEDAQSVEETPPVEETSPVEEAQAVDAAPPVAPQSLDRPPTGLQDEAPRLTIVESVESVLDPQTSETYDLGGLIGAVETWATEESVPVNAGRLFRMINDAAAVRIDIDSAVRQATQVLSNASPGMDRTGAEAVLESLEGVRRASVSLESAALGLTVVPISSITSTLPQLIKYVSKKLSRDVDLVVEGDDTLVDRQLLDRIGEMIRQLVVNAVTHGLESSDARAAAGKASIGTVRVSANRDDELLEISVSDDGMGIDWVAVRQKAVERGLVETEPTTDQLRSVLYAEGFSTNPDTSDFTGSGFGLARVTEIVKEVYGSMTLDSTRGRGTSFVIRMPSHRALQRAQTFTAGGRIWGIPESVIVDVVPIPDVSISVTEKGSTIGYRDESVPYSSFAAVAGLEIEGLPSHVMIVQSPSGLIALAVDSVLDTHEVATKDLGPLLSGSSVVSGVALLGGDETVMLVDAGRLADRLRSAEVVTTGPVHRVLVVDDSQGVRQVVSGVLASHGFSTVSAGSVSDALAALTRSEVDALVVDFSMPRADGVALIHMVRQRYGTIPVVMLSGVASEEDRARAERAGVNAFFDKADFAKGALVTTLRELIESRPGSNGSASAESFKAS